ncbi:MAG: N-acetylmuramoyl-L-alanine amidase [Eubacterium sp.]|nr:N-acetylmuramoyl-L-alanine amidase [Eubacterium sp.]
MERKMARFTAFFTCAFSLFICVAVWFLPELEQRIEAYSASIRRDQLAREERYALLEKMSGLEIMDYNTQQVQQQAEKAEKEEKEIIKEGGDPEPQEDVIVITHQMQLELPSGADASNVEVVHDLIERRIDIRIPGADKNYIYDYMVLGESGDMESLDYFSEGDSGTVALTMDKVVEADYSFDENYLYLDFLSPAEMHDRIIVVDAGHGGGAPGAVSGTHYEKNITLAIVQQLKKLFDEADDPQIGVYYTRLDDTNPSLSDRVGLANELNADLFVSVHINSLKGNPGVEGVEVMYDELAPDTAFDTKDFAQICLDEQVSALGAKKRRLIDGNKIYIIRNSIAPAALIEVGFMNNPNELARLTDPGYQKKSAQGIYQALQKSLRQLK